jgi:hypothetical protein
MSEISFVFTFQNRFFKKIIFLFLFLLQINLFFCVPSEPPLCFLLEQRLIRFLGSRLSRSF